MAYNRCIMAALHFLVPEALVASDFAPELLRDLSLPNLDRIAALGQDRPVQREHATLLAPWQDWLLQGASDPNLAVLAAAAAGVKLPAETQSGATGFWLAQPAHCEIALDHLVLTDPDQLALSATEAQALADVAAPLLQAAGWHMTVAAPHTWLLYRSPNAPPCDVRGPSAACAEGTNVGPWLPFDRGSGGALQWQRLATEVQMTWHSHPVNHAREAANLPAVNFLWLTGTGARNIDGARLTRYARIDAELPYLAHHGALPGQAERNPGAPHLVVWHGLIEPARSEHWSLWRNHVRRLDTRLGSVLEALRADRIDPLELILSGQNSLRVVRVARNDTWKFWRRGHAAELIADTSDAS